VKSFWKAHFLPCELGLTVALTLAFALWLERFAGLDRIDQIVQGQRAVIYGTIATIDGALLGFIIATIAIILGFAPGDSFTVLRQSDHYQDLWGTFRSTIRILALATLAALVGLLVDRDSSPNSAAMIVCFGFSLLVIARVSRSVWILGKVVQLVTRTN